MLRHHSQEKFIWGAKKVHGSKYDYSKVEYKNSKVKVCIICKEHGDFWQIPSDHLAGHGCSRCGHRSTTPEFIEKAKEVHGDRYDYSKVEYRGHTTKVCVICKKHGEFWQTPSAHLRGQGCSRCGNRSHAEKHTSTTSGFIEKAKKVHGDRYDYSKVDYRYVATKVCIVCKEHGEFWQTPGNHLGGSGCFQCGRISAFEKTTSSRSEFIEGAKQVHGDKYDYSKVEYKNSTTKACIVCKEHGEFWQTPNSHSAGQGCPRCSNSHPVTTSEFIEKAKQVHGDRYDYSKVEYKNSKVKVCIICKEHGEFWQTPNSHLVGQGCPRCSLGRWDTSEFIAKKKKCQKVQGERFIEKAKKVHGDRYDYSKVEYKTGGTKVCIICKKHGEFWQFPTNHLRGGECLQCYRDDTITTTSEFIEKAKKVHGDRYDYSKVDYKNSDTKVCIVCKKHGEFWQNPSNHLRGVRCPRCHGINLKDGEWCASLVEAYYYLCLKNRGVYFIHDSRYPKSTKGTSMGRCRYDFYIPSENKYVEVTSHWEVNHHGHEWKNPRSQEWRKGYWDKIERKRMYVINDLGAKFEVREIRLNPRKLRLVFANIQRQDGNRCGHRVGKFTSTTSEFIEGAKQVHGDRYDYSKVEYRGHRTKVCIVCKEHGEFWQTPNRHLQGQGCYQCGHKYSVKKQPSTTSEFIEKAKKVHGDRYDYSKVDYKNSDTKVCIVCKEHGEFWQFPTNHLRGSGCLQCGRISSLEKQAPTTSEFVEKAKQVHGDRYDYSKVEYKNNKVNICIVCKEHGEFWQTSNSHLRGYGCLQCGHRSHAEKITSTTSEFVEKAKKVHGDRYDYSKVEYKNSRTKVCIVCKEHGEFWQNPSNHLIGHRCPRCSLGRRNEFAVGKEVSCANSIVERVA